MCRKRKRFADEEPELAGMKTSKKTATLAGPVSVTPSKTAMATVAPKKTPVGPAAASSVLKSKPSTKVELPPLASNNAKVVQYRPILLFVVL